MPDIDLQDYLFDLRGYLVLRQAIDRPLVAALNEAFDGFPDLDFGEWWGRTQRLDHHGLAGMELQNIVEAGAPFEALIDHPAWVERLGRYCGEADTYVQGLFLDECFASQRRSGGFFPMHSGGQDGVVRNQYRVVNGRFRCGQVNVLLALTDIGPGDGGTRVVPGSHKANFTHPACQGSLHERLALGEEDVEGAIEVRMNAGDALMFVDAICHGAARRTNPGERRVVIYRYGPSWGHTRHGFEYSPELLSRVSEAQRRILQPIKPRRPGDRRGVET